MAKLIAICGAPHTGKTTLALKTGMALYEKCGKQPIVVLSPDVVVPTLGLFFPHNTEAELHSVGVALDRPDIIQADIIKQMNLIPGCDNLSVLGYKTGENRNSYSAPTEYRVTDLLQGLLKFTAYTIVDCTNAPDDLVSELAQRHADQTVHIVTPDLCSVIYSAGTDRKNALRVLNITERDLPLPIREMEEYFGDFGITLPYSHELKRQWITGTLTEKLQDGRYAGAINAIVRAVQ